MLSTSGHSADSWQKAALKLMQMVLQAAGSDLDKLLKVNIYLTNIKDFAAMNAVCMWFSS